jgi:hypothetical protein
VKNLCSPGPRAETRQESPRLPRTFGWLVRVAPEAASYRSQLQHFLSDPEIATLLSAAPQTRRMLRPLCRMLAIPEPKWEPIPGDKSAVTAHQACPGSLAGNGPPTPSSAPPLPPPATSAEPPAGTRAHTTFPNIPLRPLALA